MKAYKKILAVLAALIMCFSLPLTAFAADAAPAPQPGAEISFEGKSWDDVVDELLEQFGTTRYSISAAYLNLVTGEEHYVNPDNYSRAASMYKLPLNMYFADSENGGVDAWAANYPELDYVEYRDKTLIDSDNERAEYMCELLGGYNEFRAKTAKYMGSDEDKVDGTLLADNLYSARDFAQCLKLLYNESERFPGILETMQKAAQDDFFCAEDCGFDVAHKFGFLERETDIEKEVYANDCGIVFTTEPIALVMFTKDVAQPKALLGAYCSTMAKWAEYVRTAPEATAQPEPSPLVIEAPAEAAPEAEKAPFPFVVSAAVVLFLLVAMVLVIGLSIKYKLRFFWLLLAILLSAATMALSIVGVHMGTVYAKPSGDPRQSAVEFLDSICSGEYSRAYSYLRDYADLGLEAVPETPAGKLAYDALHKSFSYEITGDISLDKLDASLPMSFTYLDLSRLESAVVEETPNQLRRLVAARPMSQVYDANRNYLPEITEEAYINAVSAVLENAGSYYSTVQLQLKLSYSGGRWQVLASPALLKALNGGAGY